ncbi:beta-glucosidase [Actinopolymorpha cephalotaxi]|uniref:Exo-alpha-(1->6)-L-arabinopyranosidase n=1 Tax=Actinopolymorpha cephalotaxi TaxID=504797 RepID=A0A1I2YM60_9ACTN|nr:glycoside hydrolase family 3 C-terminal domain-containing protein [Actinopolymorpha cephalotaxi]NYH86889.1 beta-glucosidase [Actinopolymorpha cephalotaxi]SFH26703.1 beta-glucosidase [Actinopolymorpha cephalotaxi]
MSESYGSLPPAPGAPPAVGELTLEEKAALVSGSDFWHTTPVERLGIPAIMVSDGPHGLRTQLSEADHVGLTGSVPATCFPPAAGIASSWNTTLIETVGRALGTEARRWGVSVVLGPGVNIKRSPLCGRNFEYYSEDPFLAGRLGAALVRGVQSQGVGTSVKHFAANNQEDDRLRVSAEVDERTLREIYLPAFEHIVRTEQPWTVMCAYNKVNGTYASEHHWLLTTVLREEWGFTGLVVSDWGAVRDRVRALAAGLDLEMPPNLELSPASVVAAVRDGRLAESVLDGAVARVLTLVDRSTSAGYANGEPVTFDENEHHRVAQLAALESAVLLKNERGALPLRTESGATVAVVGELARTPRFQGGGSSEVNPTRVDVPVEELRDRLGPDAEVVFAAGYDLAGDAAGEERLRAEAVRVARTAARVVVFLGLPAAEESEGFDRTHLDLPAGQLALLAALREATDQPLIVVLSNGSAVRTSTWDGEADAILESWLSGQAAGGAVADLLTGRANPSGKLAETIPVRLEDNSSYLNFPGDSGVVRYGEGVFVGYRAHDRASQEVSYPFGHGLSYTTFDLGDLTVRTAGSVAGDDLAVEVSVTVTNTGPLTGAEVVQVYVRDTECSVARPVQELKGFAKVALEPGESRTATVTLDRRAFAYWSIRHHDWVVEAGDFEIAVGTSSRDLRAAATIRLDAPSLALPLAGDSTLAEWLADPQGSELLQGLDLPILLDPGLVRVVGTMPMSTLASFPGLGLDHATLADLVSRLDRAAG